MDQPNSTSPICQSCGMPMSKPEDFGTNADGSQNADYCTYCFQNGKFTLGDIPFSEMVEKLVAMHNQMGLTADQARGMANTNLPQLKRWKK